jgi:hypothetical protein
MMAKSKAKKKVKKGKKKGAKKIKATKKKSASRPKIKRSAPTTFTEIAPEPPSMSMSDPNEEKKYSWKDSVTTDEPEKLNEEPSS